MRVFRHTIASLALCLPALPVCSQHLDRSLCSLLMILMQSILQGGLQIMSMLTNLRSGSLPQQVSMGLGSKRAHRHSRATFSAKRDM